MFKKLEKENQIYKEIQRKKLETKQQKLIGYKEGDSWDKRKEKNLVKIATRGVVKLFNSIYEYKKKVKADEEDDCICNFKIFFSKKKREEKFKLFDAS